MARRTALETAVGDVYAELAKQWAASTVSFARCFNIENKDNEMVPFEPSVPQQRAFWLMENEKRIQILKGRQMWITTACVIQALKLAYFNPGMRIGVATQKTKTAKALALLYLKRYRQNPALVAMMPLLNFSSEHIRFTNGTEIIFDTANSEVWRSGVFHFVHLTECSYYDDLGALLAALGETVPKKTGVIIMETTANGEEAYCGMWKDKISTYRKQFLCWRDHLEYRDPIPFTDEILDLEADYIRKNGLDDEEASWWIRKRRGMPSENRHLMQQEYPCTPEEAFLLSGQKFLIRPVPSVPKRQADDSGIIRLYDFDPTHQYSAGCDVASGSETGDFSTIIIGDVTMRKVAASMIIRMPTIDFIKKGRALLEEYGDPITAPETGSEGPIVADSWALAGVPVFQMVTITGNEQQILPRLGWRTTPDTRPLVFGSIYEATGGMDRWEIGDYRLVDELNALCYNKNHKPAAPKGGHDDGSVGFGLMIQAIPQVRQAREKVIEEVKDVSPLSYYENLMNSAETDTRRDFFDSPDSWKAGDFF